MFSSGNTASSRLSSIAGRRQDYTVYIRMVAGCSAYLLPQCTSKVRDSVWTPVSKVSLLYLLPGTPAAATNLCPLLTNEILH